MCFINEYHKLPVLSCRCLSPISQCPGIALVRQAAPAGPRGGRVRSGFRGIATARQQLSHRFTLRSSLCSEKLLRKGFVWLVLCSRRAENVRGCRNKIRPFILGVLSRTIYKPGQCYLLLRWLVLPRIRILILKAERTACVWAWMKMKNTNLEAFVQISSAAWELHIP